MSIFAQEIIIEITCVKWAPFISHKRSFMISIYNIWKDQAIMYLWRHEGHPHICGWICLAKDKGEALKPPGELQPLPIPTVVWTDIYMDFIMDLPKYGNNSVIMVFVDCLSKYNHFFSLPFKGLYGSPSIHW